MLKPRARTSGSAITMFSSAEYSSNRLMIWNERAIPLRAMALGEPQIGVSTMPAKPRPVMSSPSKDDSGRGPA